MRIISTKTKKKRTFARFITHYTITMNRILGVILLFFVLFPLKAEKYENLQLSLLTVDPIPGYVHTIFGHTALRLNDPDNQQDIVFNWGTFDFNKPNFTWLFIKGETDYYLSVREYSYFKYVYAMENVRVTEQILDIPDNQKAALIAMLQENLRPENLEYRYNFIFDNCTSVVRDIIENFCGGTLVYPEQNNKTTFRNLIHEYTQPHPWAEIGIDFLIGSGADSLVSVRNELWLPCKLKDALNHSYIMEEDGSKRPIVLSSQEVLTADENVGPTPSGWNWPLIVGFLFLMLIIGILFAAHHKKRRYRFIPAVLFFIAGIGGCIIAITCFISTHPCTWPNWNILWLHPFHLIGFAGFFFKRMNRLITWYHRLNFVILAVFLTGWHFIPQELNTGFIPYMLCLLLISILQAGILKKKIYE